MMAPVLLLVLVVLVTALGTTIYRRMAPRLGLIAYSNFRSSHHMPKPRGAGIVFGTAYLVAIWLAWRMGNLDDGLARTVIVGGIVSAAFGFGDDVLQTSAWLKLLVQAALAMWILAAASTGPPIDFPFTIDAVDYFFCWFGLVWLMNVYNFIDGIDALAASGAVLVSLSCVALLLLSGSGDPGTMLSFGLVAAAAATFLLFNWPPATLFMGDAGSMFLGYMFASHMVWTLSTSQLGVGTWIILFGYLATDTTTTTLLRIWVSPKWYGEHCSHAYQNLARVWGSHRRVVIGVCLYQGAWLLPLSIWSQESGSVALAVGLAVIPAFLWTLRFGPLFSKV